MTIDVRMAATIDEWRAAVSLIAEDAINCAHLLHVVETAIASGRSRLPILIAHDGAKLAGIATAAPMALIYSAAQARGFSAGASPFVIHALADAIAHRVDTIKLLIAEPDTAGIAYARLAEMRETGRPTRDVAHNILIVESVNALGLGDVRNVHIRAASAADAPAIAESVGELTLAELGYDPRMRSNYLGMLQAQIARAQYFIAESSELDGPVAFCSVSIRNARTIRVDNFVVPAHLRGRGYGKAAAAAFARLFLRRAPSVSVLVRTENATARAVYTAVGFQECGALRYLHFS